MLAFLARPACISPCLAGTSNGKAIGTESAANSALQLLLPVTCGDAGLGGAEPWYLFIWLK